jgi:tetratricopeptide (TPR) repeat protein
MNTNKIERAAVRAVEEYIDLCPLFDPSISTNDRTPIWDGDIFIYKNAQSHTIDNFVNRVPLQVKGTTNVEENEFRIDREYLEGYLADRGCVFFLVQEGSPKYKILYSILSIEEIKALLKAKTKTICFQLQAVPDEPSLFEKVIIEFADKRSHITIQNPTPKEILNLVNGFKSIVQFFEEVTEQETLYDIESLIHSIESLKEDETVGWRDRFIYYSQKAVQLISKTIKEDDPHFLELQLNLGVYLYNQHLYHLAGDCYERVLCVVQKRMDVNDNPLRYYHATVLHNLGLLHIDLHLFAEAEKELKNAFEISVELSKTGSRDLRHYLAACHVGLGRIYAFSHEYSNAEKEYTEALKIYRELTSSNPDIYKKETSVTLNNLAILHFDYDLNLKAEDEFKESLKLFRELAVNDSSCLADVASTLNNLAALHDSQNKVNDAENEYSEALTIYRELADMNPNAYQEELSQCLGNIAVLHKRTCDFDKAELEFKEVLEIQQDLAKKYPDAYNHHLAESFGNLANLYSLKGECEKAEKYYDEALCIFRKLALLHPNAYNCFVIGTLCNQILLHTRTHQYETIKNEISEVLNLYWSAPDSIPISVSIKLITVLRDIAIVGSPNKTKMEMEADLGEVLKICNNLSKIDAKAYSHYQLRVLCILANIHISQQRLQDADSEMKEALELFYASPDSIQEDLISSMTGILRDLFSSYLEQKKHSEAERVINSVLRLYSTLDNIKPGVYSEYVGMSFMLLALVQQNQNNNEEAKRSCEEAISILNKLPPTPQISHDLEQANALLSEICAQLS